MNNQTYTILSKNDLLSMLSCFAPEAKGYMTASFYGRIAAPKHNSSKGERQVNLTSLPRQEVKIFQLVSWELNNLETIKDNYDLSEIQDEVTSSRPSFATLDVGLAACKEDLEDVLKEYEEGIYKIKLNKEGNGYELIEQGPNGGEETIAAAWLESVILQ